MVTERDTKSGEREAERDRHGGGGGKEYRKGDRGVGVREGRV